MYENINFLTYFPSPIMDNKETHFTHFTLVFSLRKYRLTHLMLIKSTLYNNKKYHTTNNYIYIIYIIGPCKGENYASSIITETCVSVTYCKILFLLISMKKSLILIYPFSIFLLHISPYY